MDLHLTGKAVVITGGGTGIGRAIAEEYLKEGARVAICGRRIAPLESFASEMKEKGFDVYYESADVSVRESVTGFAEHVEEKFGTIDIWISNAGIDIRKRFLDYTDEDFLQIADVNLKGVFICTQVAGEVMKRHGGGVIINASSWNSILPHANNAIYSATKAGVSNFTKSTAAALAPFGIRVLGYVPGMIVTDLSRPLIAGREDAFIKDMAIGRLGSPEDLAGPVVFLSSDRASFLTGINVEIAGGKFAVQDCRMAYRMEEEAAAAEAEKEK